MGKEEKMIPRFSAEWWELYTVTKDCDEAAKAITEAYFEAVKSATKLMGTMQTFNFQDAAHQVYKDMTPVMYKYRHFGASDTEPMSNLRRTIYFKFGVRL